MFIVNIYGVMKINNDYGRVEILHIFQTYYKLRETGVLHF